MPISRLVEAAQRVEAHVDKVYRGLTSTLA
jgi:hypothetical protein